MKKEIIILLLWVINTGINYLIIATILDIIVMGAPRVRFSLSCRKKTFLITKLNRTDMQTGYQCSGFSSAYVLRHWDLEGDGNRLYEVIPNKANNGLVAPKGILKLLSQHGFKPKYCAGNISSLKNEVSKGNPVIAMIRVQADRNWLHYVPVVGYDEQYIFIAESLEKLVNCNEPYYNRKISIREFKKLWNTSMFKMPLYRNTFITAFPQQFSSSSAR